MTDSRVRYPLTLFTILACLFGWAFIIAHSFGIGDGGGQLPLGPIIAALIVSIALGRSGIRWWGGRLATVKAAPGWYLFAVLAPIAIMVAAVLANSAFGAPLPTSAQLRGWTALGPTFLGILIAIGIGEEAGWTAFAAPRLLERHSFLRAWLILAAIRTAWHLPLMYSGDLSLTIGIAGNFAFQFLVLWLVQRTGVWFLAAIWHGVLNTVGGMFLSRMVTGTDQARLGLLMVAGYTAFAVAVAVLDRRRLASPPPR